MNSSVNCERRDESPIGAYFLKVLVVPTLFQGTAFMRTKLLLPAASLLLYQAPASRLPNQ